MENTLKDKNTETLKGATTGRNTDVPTAHDADAVRAAGRLSLSPYHGQPWHGTALCEPSRDPGCQSSRPSRDPGRQSSRPSRDPGRQSSRPSRDPGASELTALPGPRASELTAHPGPRGSELTALPGPRASELTALPGPRASELTALPGPRASELTALPGPRASELSTPGTLEVRAQRSRDPGRQSSRPSRDPGQYQSCCTCLHTSHGWGCFCTATPLVRPPQCDANILCKFHSSCIPRHKPCVELDLEHLHGRHLQGESEQKVLRPGARCQALHG